MSIRRAHESDLPAILSIYNHEILTGTAIYIDEPQTLEQRAHWLAVKQEAGLPVFVLEDADGVAGFGTYGPFRFFPGYRFCVEHSVYVAHTKRRLGYGKQLLATVIEAVSAQGMHTMIAAIDAENEGSIKLHSEFGFTRVGHLPQVACKFNRWLDLVLLQKTLDGRGTPEPEMGQDKIDKITERKFSPSC
jgi:L-amino acid N-acyltransferase YncA